MHAEPIMAVLALIFVALLAGKWLGGWLKREREERELQHERPEFAPGSMAGALYEVHEALVNVVDEMAKSFTPIVERINDAFAGKNDSRHER